MYNYTEVSEEQWQHLVSIRDSIGSIDGLDSIYQNRVHPNGLPYHIYVPEALSPGTAYPLVMFLHGATDLGLETHKGFPKGIWSQTDVQTAHPHVLFLPRFRTETDEWTRDEYSAMVMEALDDLIAELNKNPGRPDIDVGRIYITGFSLGGKGTWDYLRRYPDRFAAACPLAGFSAGPQDESDAIRIRHIPTWIFSGSRDDGVEGSRTSFRALKATRARDVRYHEFTGHGHVIDDFVWFTDGLMDWMFSQKQSPWEPAGPVIGETRKIVFLHHSTGKTVWDAGVRKWFKKYNKKNKTDYDITDREFPADSPYGWNNYPYDYWNIWVNNAGDQAYKNEPTLEMLTAEYDVIVFKHCFPVSGLRPDTGAPDVASPEKRLENYVSQYAALKEKMRQFPGTKFIVWTGAALVEAKTETGEAERARKFFNWVKNEWNEQGDNIHVWDFHGLETEGGLYLKSEYAKSSTDSHPHKKFAKKVVPLFCERVVEVIEDR